ncbi:MAG: Asp23/Gls24 family envelope stress response protein [Chloroflexi bacterium]|nr:Asp23/Gls24 family envelope stress response protein [Chloroflexota bacterium]
MATEEKTQGKIEIAPAAIASLTSQAVLQCYGVVGLAAKSLKNGIAELLHHQESHRRGVEVQVRDGRITIHLFVILQFGTRISEVARNIQESVKYNVEQALGTAVAEVNVHILGLRDGASAKETRGHRGK